VTRYVIAVPARRRNWPGSHGRSGAVLRAAADLHGFGLEPPSTPSARGGRRGRGTRFAAATAGAVTQAKRAPRAVGHPRSPRPRAAPAREAGLLALRKLLGAYANLRPWRFIGPASRLAAPARRLGRGGSAYRAGAARGPVLLGSRGCSAGHGGQPPCAYSVPEIEAGWRGSRSRPRRVAGRSVTSGGQGQRASKCRSSGGDGDTISAGVPRRDARSTSTWNIRGDAPWWPAPHPSTSLLNREPVR